MAARYIGRKPLRLANGRIIKHNDIVNEITDEQAKARMQFEPVTETRIKKKDYKESGNE